MTAVKVVGAGLAGCEAAWQLARLGVPVELFEMKPDKKSPAHVSDGFAELVCSNSLRNRDVDSAVGLLKEEMRRLGSLIIQCADKTEVPAGGALAVDREAFSAMVTERILENDLITVVRREIAALPDGKVIIATGPLTSDALSAEIAKLTGNYLSFFDASSPIVTFDSVDMEKAFFASRYDRSTPDYINCPMDRDEYENFRRELVGAETAAVRDFENDSVFEGCMPIEVMAARGVDTIRYGPLKPVGLTDPRTGKTPYAVVQLRKDNRDGTIYNLVGFQTHLKFDEQKRVFSMIPALHGAEFMRFGVMHRNTYIDSPKLLDRYYRLRDNADIRFAGQITGVEGYVESAASGLLTGLETAREIKGLPPADFTDETAIGALSHYISSGAVSDYQPMNINYGIVRPLEYRVKGKKNRNRGIAERSLNFIDEFLKVNG